MAANPCWTERMLTLFMSNIMLDIFAKSRKGRKLDSQCCALTTSSDQPSQRV